jgi:hypothetical protein
MKAITTEHRSNKNINFAPVILSLVEHKERNVKYLFSFIVLVLFGLPASANDVSKLLESKSSSERASILSNLLHQSGKGCGKATRTFLQGYDKDNAAYWNVSCNNGQSYNVQVPEDPSAKTRIMECSIMKAIGVECFKKFSN